MLASLTARQGGSRDWGNRASSPLDTTRCVGEGSPLRKWLRHRPSHDALEGTDSGVSGAGARAVCGLVLRLRRQTLILLLSTK